MSKLVRRFTYHTVPEVAAGYILDPTAGYFSIIVPEERTNYVWNPSFETNDDQWSASGASAFARVSTYARRGLYSLQCTPTAALTDGIGYSDPGLGGLPAGYFSYSIDLWAYPGVPMIFEATTGGVTRSVITVGKGRWERIGGVHHAALAGGASLTIRKNNSWSTYPFYVDGAQIESGLYPTTYIDGDQVGYKQGLLDYFWLGNPHDSFSKRTANCRSGGKVVPLKDLGLEVMSFTGLGMAGVENDIMDFGTLDGGEYHDTHMPTRQFTITGAIFGKLHGKIQQKRKDIIDVLKPDLVIPKQAMVLRYEFGRGCEKDGLVLELPSVYVEGMGGQFDNFHQERIALTFNAPWPYLLEDGYEGKIIDDLDSTDDDAWSFRDTGGQWHNYAHATSGGGAAKIYDILQSDHWGGLFFAGDFDTFAGVASQRLAFMDLGTRAITQFNPWADGTILVLHESPRGYLYMGGEFDNIIGAKPHLAYMDAVGAIQDLAGGADDTVRAIATTYNNDVYIGGDFANVGTGGGAIVAAFIAMYDDDAAVWVNITPAGACDGIVRKILVGADGKIYVGGHFSNIDTVPCSRVAVYDPVTGVWDNLGDGLTGGNVSDMCFGADGRLYAVGSFTGPPAYFAVFNGANWEQLGSGIQTTIIGTTAIYKICRGPDGKLWLAGDFAIKGPFQNANFEYCSWDGSTFGYLDAQPPGQADGQACDGLDICVTNGNEIAVSFDYGTATPGARFYCGQAQTFTNNGSSIAHPTLVCQITGGQYGYMYIRNVTTGDELRFAMLMDDGGRFWVDMTPGKIRSWSNYRPVEQTLFDGSDLATFKLAPGANRIVVFSHRSEAGAVAETGMYWRKNYWSADSGVA
jgi:hypothetical protein